MTTKSNDSSTTTGSQNAGHTPGPWELHRYSNYTGWSVFAPGRGCIAERWYETDQEPPYAEELLANARLIAASPDMLAALKECVEMLDDMFSDPKKPVPQYSGDKRRMTQARAAIARATGAQP